MSIFTHLFALASNKPWETVHRLQDGLKNTNDNALIMAGLYMFPLVLRQNEWAANDMATTLLKATQNTALQKMVTHDVLKHLYEATTTKDAVAQYMAQHLLEASGIHLPPQHGFSCKAFALSAQGGSNNRRVLFVFPPKKTQEIRVATYGFNGVLSDFNEMTKRMVPQTQQFYATQANAATLCREAYQTSKSSRTNNFLGTVAMQKNTPKQV